MDLFHTFSTAGWLWVFKFNFKKQNWLGISGLKKAAKKYSPSFPYEGAILFPLKYEWQAIGDDDHAPRRGDDIWGSNFNWVFRPHFTLSHYLEVKTVQIRSRTAR